MLYSLVFQPEKKEEDEHENGEFGTFFLWRTLWHRNLTQRVFLKTLDDYASHQVCLIPGIMIIFCLAIWERGGQP